MAALTRLTQLPPLQMEKDTGKLIKGLQEWKSSGVGFLPKGPKDPISPVSRRANACIEEVECECVSFEVAQLRQRGVSISFDDSQKDVGAASCIASATAAFDNIVSEIDEALHGGNNALRTLRPRDSFSEHIAPRIDHTQEPRATA